MGESKKRKERKFPIKEWEKAKKEKKEIPKKERHLVRGKKNQKNSHLYTTLGLTFFCPFNQANTIQTYRQEFAKKE